jgi:hypothetical protein
MTNLSALTAIWLKLRQDIMESHAVDEDDPWLEGTLEGETDLMDRLRSLLRKRRELLAHADALKGMVGEIQDRQARMEHSAKAIASAVTGAMQEAGIAKIKGPDFSASISYGKAPLLGLEHLSPDALPPKLLRIKKEINRTAVREALESGEHLEGCYLGNAAPFITVRVK